jgi:hypothetical protein
MRRSASEIIRNLEQRIARLERQPSNRTASPKIRVSISTGYKTRKMVEMMTVQGILSEVKSEVADRSVVKIIPDGKRSQIKFILTNFEEGSSIRTVVDVSLFSFASAVENSHSSEMDSLYMNAGIVDLEDRFDKDKDVAYAIKDYLQTSRGSFGGGLGSDWLIEVL